MSAWQTHHTPLCEFHGNPFKRVFPNQLVKLLNHQVARSSRRGSHGEGWGGAVHGHLRCHMSVNSSACNRISCVACVKVPNKDLIVIYVCMYVFLPLSTPFITPSYPQSHSPGPYNHLQFYDYGTQRVVKQGSFSKASDLVD